MRQAGSRGRLPGIVAIDFMYILMNLEFVQGADYASQYLHVLSLIGPTGNSEIIESTLFECHSGVSASIIDLT